MNLLLTSCGLETETIRQAFLQMLRKPAAQAKALFVPTAANSPDAVEVLPKCLGDLLRCGIPREHIQVYDLHDPLEPDWMQRIDVVYLCGGSPSYLLRRINEGPFREELLAFLRNGGAVIGVSAGSVVFAGQMERSLGLLPCPLHVHCSEADREAPGSYPMDRKAAVMLGERQAIRFEQNAMIIFE